MRTKLKKTIQHHTNSITYLSIIVLEHPASNFVALSKQKMGVILLIIVTLVGKRFFFAPEQI